MKIFHLIIAFIMMQCCSAQNAKVKSNMVVDGIAAFKQEVNKENPNYTRAFKLLTKQVSQNPNNAELHYFLGYCIDRINADDGKGMYKLTKALTIQASEQFEKVNQLEPIYKGEIFILDPYSKISSIWGSMAEAYLNRKQHDSAKWAFREGKRRGGFIEPILEFNRQLLNSCADSALLITYGDNITIPIWYLQTIENFRTDITVIDANLLNAPWYPKYLKYERNVSMRYSDKEIDTLNYMPWKSQEVSIENPINHSQYFSWQLGPTYMDNYLLKGDLMMLDIFEQNFFKRPIYFTNNSDSSYNLYLSPYLKDEGLVNKVTQTNFEENNIPFEVSPNMEHYHLKDLQSEEIAKSKDAIIILNGFRWAFLENAMHLSRQENYIKARDLLNSMQSQFNSKLLPFSSKEHEAYYRECIEKINEKNR